MSEGSLRRCCLPCSGKEAEEASPIATSQKEEGSSCLRQKRRTRGRRYLTVPNLSDQPQAGTFRGTEHRAGPDMPGEVWWKAKNSQSWAGGASRAWLGLHGQWVSSGGAAQPQPTAQKPPGFPSSCTSTGKQKWLLCHFTGDIFLGILWGDRQRLQLTLNFGEETFRGLRSLNANQ